MDKKATAYLIDSPVLDVINNLLSIMTPSWSEKKGATTFVDIIHNFGC